LRQEVRQELRIPETALAILLVGNDWQKKGLPCLIEAVARLRNQDLRILVRGTDQPSLCRDLIKQHGLESRVIILPLVPDIERHYAAADMYVGPSLEDSFAIPPLEAMACGLPAIVSRQAGASEIVTHGVDGFVLEDPRDSEQLAHLIRRISVDAELRAVIGVHAAETARHYTWQRNAQEMKWIFDQCLREKRQHGPLSESAVAKT
jgi:UDP-glucose:(heptosyl)LPS alpha-1,3-glucosyltransferase